MRVSITGTSGSGKTTFARMLSEAIGGAHIDLDAINWQADWYDLNRNEPEEFRRRVAAAVEAERWAACGNYTLVRDLIRARATHIVWLDYPKRIVMGRVFRRSFARAWTGDELWPGTGNTETFLRWLDKEHPIRWAWDTYALRRQKNAAEFADPALAHVEKIRLRHPREAAPLIERLAQEASSPPA